MRESPNIIITGTPGVGKTSHCDSLAGRLELRHISVNQVVKDKECHEGWSEEYQSWIVDEDKVSRTRTFVSDSANSGSCWTQSRTTWSRVAA